MAISSSSSSSSSVSEVQKCSKQCLESFKTLQKNYDTKREKHNKAKLEIRGYEIALESLESRILGHEKNELAWERRVVKERDELKDKIAKWEESTKNLDEILNSQMSARDKTGLGYGTQLNELRSNHETNSENSLSIFDVRSSDEENTPENDRFSKNGYKAVPPPHKQGNFLTRKSDPNHLQGQTNDENTEKPKSASESVVSNPKIDRDRVIIEDWNSNDEEEMNELQTVRPETQTVKTRDDKSGVLTRTGLHRPSVSFARPVCTTRPSVSTARPVCTAKPSVSTARPVYAARPIYPRMDNAFRDLVTGSCYDPKGGKITGKGKIKTANLDFDDVYFIDELKFNLFSVSQMYDKKNNVLFTESKCLILSPSFKLLNKSQVVLRAPRKDDVYSLDLKNIVPSRGLENQLSHNVKIIRCDNGTEFKNHAMNEFYAKKGIKREFSRQLILLASTEIVKPLVYYRVYNKRTKRVEENLHINFLEDQPNVTGTGPNWMFDLDFLTNSMNYIPVSVENQVNVDAGTQDSYVAGSSGKDKGPTQEYILLPLQPYRTRIPVEDVPPAAHEKPSECYPRENNVQDSKDAANKESEQDLQDELEKMVTQELAAKAMDDVSRQAFEEEKRRIASQKKATQATSTNKLSTDRPSVSTDRPSVSTDRPFVSTDRSNTPYVSAASTPTGANAGESSLVYLGRKIPIDASTLPNADLPIDLNMPDLEDASDTLPNDGIFNGAYDDDEDVGAVADFNNMDNTITISPIPTLRIHKDHPKGQILGDPTSAVQTRGKIQKDSSAQEALFKLQKVWVLVDLPYGKKVIGTKWVFRNKRDERSIVVKNKAWLIAQGFRQ
ncbi:ribonuclease H-like domain-containing protein [Tanacetum coccineum]